jgi:hypothetical protein
MPLRRALAALAAALCLLVAGCARSEDRRGAAPPPPEPPPTTTTTVVPSTTTAPPPAPTTSAIPPPANVRRAPPQPATASCPAVPARAYPRPDRPRYTLGVDVRLADNVVVGDLRVRFTPDLETDRLVFRLWANAPRTARGGARLEVGEVRVDGRPAPTHQPDSTTLVVPLARPARAGQPVEAALDWRLALPGATNDRISRSGDAVRLGSFFPLLAWEPGAGWATEPPTSGFAEASLAPVADFTVTVTVPDGLGVLATGVRDAAARWTAVASPDFALSVGRFNTQTRTVHAPDPVEVTVGVEAAIAEAPGPYLDKLTRVLQDFARRFGPYPWPVYTLALTPELSGGIEYPMHVMQGPGSLGRTTSHEVGHMWFYGLVTSNQGRHPWIDEGLATWAEARYENTLAEIRARPIPPDGRGRAGEPMTFWESRQAAYFRSVYLQPAQALAALGAADLVDCALRHYVARNAYRVARPADVVEAMELVFPGAAEVLGRYGIRR